LLQLRHIMLQWPHLLCKGLVVVLCYLEHLHDAALGQQLLQCSTYAVHIKAANSNIVMCLARGAHTRTATRKFFRSTCRHQTATVESASAAMMNS
jgi:hypothetical protein